MTMTTLLLMMMLMLLLLMMMLSCPQDCEYGDRTSSCLKSQCLSANRGYLYSCCETCTYGTPITTDSTTTTMKCKPA